MRDDDDPVISTPPPLIYGKKEPLDYNSRGGSYKFYALAAIILLAFWSMLTGTVTLRFSAGGDLNRFSDDISGAFPIRDDFDILEIEEREKIVEHMWDVYINSDRMIKLARFWQEAFVAAYEDLISDASQVREAAVTEIAMMSFRSIDLDLPVPPPHSTNLRELRLREPQQNRVFMSGGIKV